MMAGKKTNGGNMLTCAVLSATADLLPHKLAWGIDKKGDSRSEFNKFAFLFLFLINNYLSFMPTQLDVTCKVPPWPFLLIFSYKVRKKDSWFPNSTTNPRLIP